MIDSFSYLFRTIDNVNVNRVQMSYEILTELQKLAERFKCAVIYANHIFALLLTYRNRVFEFQIVITNELTTRFTADNEPQLMPALGDSHIHRMNCQITLGRDVNDRQMFAANIDKCFYGAEKTVTFLVSDCTWSRDS